MRHKVCVVTSRHPEYDQRILLREAVTLAERGYDVVLYAPNAKLDNYRGVQIRGFRQGRGLLGRLASLPKLVRLVAGERPTVCHVHDPDLIVMAPLLRRVWHSRVVVDIHEFYTARFDHWYPLARKLASSAIAAALRLGALSADRIIAAVPGISDELGLPESRTNVIWNYPLLTSRESEIARRDDVTEPLTAIYVGTLSHSYGSFVILEAAQLMPSIRFIIIGRFCDAAVEQAFKTTASAAPNVEFAGFIPPHSLDAWWSRADVGLSILPRTPAIDLSLPTKLVEYMQAGLAVITTDTALSQKMVRETGCGLVVSEFSADCVAEALAFMEAHRAEVREMGRRGRERAVAELNWRSEGEKLIAVYEQLLDSTAVTVQ